MAGFEDLLVYVVPIIVVVVALMLINWALDLRRIVPVGYADIVTRKTGIEVYSVDTTVVKNVDGTPRKEPKTVYYEIPGWIPKWGVYVRRMPLTIIKIPVEDYKTFGKGNARFVVDVAVFCRIIDVLQAAQRFPGKTIDDFINSIQSIIVSTVRKTTANFAVEDVIGKREEIATEVAKEIEIDFRKWGVELTNVAVVDIKDPYKADTGGKVLRDDKTGEPILETTVIRDISNKKEAEINSLSRQEVAMQQRKAAIAEAEARQASETRKIEADEYIGRRGQEKDQNIAIEEKKAVAMQMEVKRTADVTTAEIEALAKIKKSEGDRTAMATLAEGQRQKFTLEAEGQKQKLSLEGQGQGEATRAVGIAQAEANKAVGLANAEVVKQTKFAEADGLSRLADAQAKQQSLAIQIRQLEVSQIVGVEVAHALQNAKLEYIGSGPAKDFFELFTPGGGLNLGGMFGAGLRAVQATDKTTYDKIMKAADKLIGGDSTNSTNNVDVGDTPPTPPAADKKVKKAAPISSPYDEPSTPHKMDTSPGMASPGGLRDRFR
jgi:regulator of protease activity HflC (stomatin/prohibitin superfamily)